MHDSLVTCIILCCLCGYVVLMIPCQRVQASFLGYVVLSSDDAIFSSRILVVYFAIKVLSIVRFAFLIKFA